LLAGQVTVHRLEGKRNHELHELHEYRVKMVKGAKREKGKLAFHAFRPPSPVIRVIRVIRGSFNLLPRERLRYGEVCRGNIAGRGARTNP
jgi:hypothetical protein